MRAVAGKIWDDFVRVRRTRGTGVEVAEGPPVPAVEPMPPARIDGPGRDRRYRLPQFLTTIHGIRTAFTDAGQGPPLVFLHGLAGNVTHWVHLAPRFAERRRVIAADLPGCGESSFPPGRLSVAAYADHVATLLERIGVGRASFVGHSLGGMVAAEIGLRHPERVDRLVLVNPAGMQSVPPALRVAGHLLLRPGLLATVLPPLWKQVLGLVFRRDNQHTRDFIRTVEQTYRVEDIHGIAAVIAGLKPDFLHRDFLADLDRLVAPTLLVWGEQDLLTPAHGLRRAATRLPNVTAREIPQCGHLPIIECPDLLADLIEKHLGPPGGRHAGPLL